MDQIAADHVVQEQDATGNWVDIPADPVETPAPAKVVAEDAAEPAAPVDPKKGKPRHDPEARIAQVVAKQKEAERRAEEAERRAADREREISELRAPKKQAAPAAPAKDLKFPDYATYLGTNPDASLEDWIDARDEWKDTRAAAKAQADAQDAHTEQTFAARVNTFGGRFAEAAKADPDLKERLDKRLLGVKPLTALTKSDKALINSIADPRERNEVTFRCFLADQWIDDEHAVAILEWLSDDAEFQRLATLPPNRVIREIANHVNGLPAATSAAPARQAKPAQSKAPAPIAPLRSTPHQSADEAPDDDASDDDFYRFEKARMARERGRR